MFRDKTLCHLYLMIRTSYKIPFLDNERIKNQDTLKANQLK